jgi:hypothetical protein
VDLPISLVRITRRRTYLVLPQGTEAVRLAAICEIWVCTKAHVLINQLRYACD